MEINAQTDKLKATIEANKRREVSELNMKKLIMEKEAEQKIAKLNDEITKKPIITNLKNFMILQL